MKISGRAVVRVQRNGRVTIPIDLRTRFGLNQGDVVIVEETPGGVLLVPARLCGCGAAGTGREAARDDGDSEPVLTTDPVESPGITIMRHLGEVLRSRLRDGDPVPVH